jgi:6-pyruvoyltetrahydropterin/6-carboxytetrahydropterin synthase
MIATLSRDYTFEAAHWLPLVPEGHKCKAVHGHSYRVTVLVRGPVGTLGWVCDFAEIDAVARPIIARLDHSTLNDVVPNPTSELLCAWLLRELAAVPHLHAVTVRETERSACTVAVDHGLPA